MLYAQPPLYHLNAATAKQRIKEIRYADKFFHPLGERLATQALTQFKWLNKTRILQETVFSDGTKLFANFSAQDQHIYKYTIQPMSLIEIKPNGTARYYSCSRS